MLARVGRKPSFSLSLVYICRACGAQKTHKHTSRRQQGCGSRVPVGNGALPRHVVKASLVSVLQPDGPCIAGSRFPVTRVGDITPCTWLLLVWLSGCHRHCRHKRNITHMQAHILQISQLTWLRTLWRVQNVTFSLCICTFFYKRHKENQKSRSSRGLVGGLWVRGVSPGAHSDFWALFLF